MSNRLGLAAGALLAAFSVLPAATQEFTLRIASPTTNSPTEKWMEDFKAAIEEHSGGRIAVQNFPSGQLGSIPSTIDGAALGTIEIAAPATGFLAALEPRFLVLDTPGLFTSFEQAQKVLADPEVIDVLTQFGKDKGVEVLAVLPFSETSILSHKAVKTIEDFKGQRVRVPGGGAIYTSPLEAMGASPIAMPLGEVTSAMQNRTIDGFVAGNPIFVGLKLYDVTPHLTEVPGGMIFVGVMANAVFMDSLGDELATIVRKEARKTTSDMAKWTRENNGKMLEAWKKNGGEVIEMPAEEQAKYNAAATGFLPGYLTANKQFKEDYDLLKAAAERIGD